MQRLIRRTLMSAPPPLSPRPNILPRLDIGQRDVLSGDGNTTDAASVDPSMALAVERPVPLSGPQVTDALDHTTVNDATGPITGAGSAVCGKGERPLLRAMYGDALGDEVGSVEGQCTVDPLRAYEVIRREDHNAVAPVSDSHVERGLELGPDRVVRHGCETKAMLFGGQDIRDIIEGDRDEDRKAEPRSVFCPQFGQMMPTVESGNDA